jgi:uncharacterized membrane protein YeiH
MSFTDFVTVLEMIGSAAFAVSGVVVAKKKKMDIFGAVILGCMTAVGGGFIRDLILGITPPSMFTNPAYVFCAFIVSLITFFVEYKEIGQLEKHRNVSDLLLNITDTIGLAIFAIMGALTAIKNGYGDNHFLCIFVGTLTGIGGGIFRDMLAGEMPLIMKERVYGVAAILGSMVFVYGFEAVGELYAMIISFVATVLIRYLAIRYRWNLPRLK